MDDLDRGTKDTEKMLARYLHAAIQEIDVAIYLEQHQMWPDGTHMIGEDGEFIPDSAHSQYFMDRHQAARAHDFYGAQQQYYTDADHDYLASIFSYPGYDSHVHHGLDSPYIRQHNEKIVHAHEKGSPDAGAEKKDTKKKGQKSNQIDLGSNGTDAKDSDSGTVINIEGPVIVGGGADLAELVRQAMQPQ